jgi:predicted Na+-dependent transporter
MSIAKLAQIAKGNLAFSVDLMGLLMVFTVVNMPVVLPRLLQGVSVDHWSIARPLNLLMLIPLATGHFIKARSAEMLGGLHPPHGKGIDDCPGCFDRGRLTDASESRPCGVRQGGDHRLAAI